MINQELDCDYLSIVDFFKSTEFFRPLCPSNIVKMVNRMDKIQLKKGETLIGKGRLLDGLYIVFPWGTRNRLRRWTEYIS